MEIKWSKDVVTIQDNFCCTSQWNVLRRSTHFKFSEFVVWLHEPVLANLFGSQTNPKCYTSSLCWSHFAANFFEDSGSLKGKARLALTHVKVLYWIITQQPHSTQWEVTGLAQTSLVFKHSSTESSSELTIGNKRLLTPLQKSP